LQGLKGLTEKEAQVFFVISSRQKVCVNDVKQIFSELSETISRSKAYTVVEKFVKAGLISPLDGNSKKQEFKAVHPRAILNELKTSLKEVEKEIIQLEQSYDLSDFEAEDPRDICQTLKSESDITTICYVLKKTCEMKIIQNEDAVIKPFLLKLTDCGEILKGKTNIILFKNGDGSKAGVIHIIKRPAKVGHRIFGQIMYDLEKYKYFYENEVKKK
jgi:Fe2+ or Zn2+ uptake regulation protein